MLYSGKFKPLYFFRFTISQIEIYERVMTLYSFVLLYIIINTVLVNRLITVFLFNKINNINIKLL